MKLINVHSNVKNLLDYVGMLVCYFKAFWYQLADVISCSASSLGLPSSGDNTHFLLSSRVCASCCGIVSGWRVGLNLFADPLSDGSVVGSDHSSGHEVKRSS